MAEAEGECSSKYKINEYDDNDDSKPFKELVYWKNFKSIRFFISLPSNFLSQLEIPTKFSEKMRDELPEMVVLKSPGGTLWEVQLVRDDNDILVFKDGWKEFAKAHNFKENDLLMFKYNRKSCFKVCVFSGRNFCEKAGSYYVWKSLEKKDAGENSQQKKRKFSETAAETAVNNESRELEVSDLEWGLQEAMIRRSRRQPVFGFGRSDAEAKPPTIMPHTSRSPLSEAEKKRALQVASIESANKSFVLDMSVSNVSNYYQLSTPAAWSRTYMARRNQDVVLCADGKKWTARFNVEPRSGGGVLVSGWSKFAVDNSLEESDICLFTLVSQEGELATFDVSIVHAREINH